MAPSPRVLPTGTSRPGQPRAGPMRIGLALHNGPFGRSVVTRWALAEHGSLAHDAEPWAGCLMPRLRGCVRTPLSNGWQRQADSGLGVPNAEFRVGEPRPIAMYRDWGPSSEPADGLVHPPSARPAQSLRPCRCHPPGCRPALPCPRCHGRLQGPISTYTVTLDRPRRRENQRHHPGQLHVGKVIVA